MKYTLFIIFLISLNVLFASSKSNALDVSKPKDLVKISHYPYKRNVGVLDHCNYTTEPVK